MKYSVSDIKLDQYQHRYLSTHLFDANHYFTYSKLDSVQLIFQNMNSYDDKCLDNAQRLRLHNDVFKMINMIHRHLG